MLLNSKILNGFELLSLDKKIGHVKDFYFDDKLWGIRYLIADTGNWLKERKVLISPHALQEVNREDKTITINLTRQQIIDSPILSNEQTVSQQYEEAYFSYYGWSTYWGGPFLWGESLHLPQGHEKMGRSADAENTWDPHLRSMVSVMGYHFQAIDGDLGHVKDFIINIESWAIRYLIIDTQNWWPGKKILISPKFIDNINCEKTKVVVSQIREIFKNAPEYKGLEELTPKAEHELQAYFLDS